MDMNKDNIVSVTKEYLVNATTHHGYTVVFNTDETCTVPHDTGNRHYQIILDWVADGNAIGEPA